MEGLEITELLLSEMKNGNEVFRIDAEYFSKRALNTIRKLYIVNAVPLAKLAEITDGIHTSLPFIEEGEVKVLSAQHPKDNYIDCNQCETVSTAFHLANPRTALQENDILISTVGTIGNAAVVTPDILPANSDRHIGIIRLRKSNISPQFVSTFLVSWHGRIQSTRETTGNVQPNLFISKMKRLLIPRFSREFEEAVVQQVDVAYAIRKDVANLLTQAETTLLHALGLENWQAPEPLSYIRNSRDVFTAERMDAEHYQPRYKHLCKCLGKISYKRIGEIQLYNRRGVQPVYDEDGAYDVINSQHIGSEHIDYENLQKTTEDDFRMSPEAQIQYGDLLIYSTGAYVGRTNVYLKTTPALASNHVNILRLSKNIDHAYMAIVLQSIVGQYQTKEHIRGSAQAELYSNDIEKFIVPILPFDKQKEIGNLAINSLKKRDTATRLLESAKRAVEIAIEESEASAEKWLREVTAHAG